MTTNPLDHRAKALNSFCQWVTRIEELYCETFDDESYGVILKALQPLPREDVTSERPRCEKNPVSCYRVRCHVPKKCADNETLAQPAPVSEVCEGRNKCGGCYPGLCLDRDARGIPQPAPVEDGAFRCGVHEAYHGRCVHCDIEFKDGLPVTRPQAIDGEVANLLTDIAQILDVVKGEWAEAWSAFDQSCRDRITKYLITKSGGEKKS